MGSSLPPPFGENSNGVDSLSSIGGGGGSGVVVAMVVLIVFVVYEVGNVSRSGLGLGSWVEIFELIPDL